MKFELAPLPYAKDALDPHMGRETLEYHYEKHHRGCGISSIGTSSLSN
jgi:Fe-Mn family superoxide dismutase